jgi:CubicO group peptidase (beta-lactamase class C family)
MLHVTDSAGDADRDMVRIFNLPQVRSSVVPAATGFSTARDMARLYAAIASGGALDGARFLQPETVERMLAVQVDGDVDATDDLPVRRSLGFELGGLNEPRRHWPGASSTARTFWHGGFGSSICWGDADTGLAMAFLTNGVRRDAAGAIARRDLSDAVRSMVR